MEKIIKRPLSCQPMPENAKRVFKGTLFEVYQWEQLQFDGRIKVFEKIKRPDSAYIMPIDSNGNIYICYQEQPGSLPYYGLIGGRIENDEDPISAAKRELIEEAGIESSNFFLWKSFQFLPKIDWAIYVFLAKDLAFRERHLDSGEKIKIEKVSLNELINLAASSKFGNVDIALLLLRTFADDTEYNILKEHIYSYT